MKFLKNDSSIILLDLSMLFKELEEICNRYGIDFETIRYNKVNIGVRFLWIDLGSNIIAYSLNGKDEEVKVMGENLLKMKPIQPFEPKSLPIILETDAILDKINEYGMESLAQEEKEFLSKLK